MKYFLYIYPFSKLEGHEIDHTWKNLRDYILGTKKGEQMNKKEQSKIILSIEETAKC